MKGREIVVEHILRVSCADSNKSSLYFNIWKHTFTTCPLSFFFSGMHQKYLLKLLLTFALFVAWLQFSIVTDDPCVLTVAAIVRAGFLFDAVYQGALLATTLHIVHMDGPRPCPKVCQHAGLCHPSVEDRRFSIKGQNESVKRKLCRR